MISEKKIEFLVNQGFDRDIIKLLIECGVESHLIWFLSMRKKGLIEHLNTEDIKCVNSYLKNTPSHKMKKISYSEALFMARKFEKNEKRKEKNKIYHFKNGYYISILNQIDLEKEGESMSNCVSSYQQRVSSGELGLLALKQLNGKTVAHIEIHKNGLIGQNFSKANSRINKEHWMMILEFFEKNSKSVDLSKIFGESHIATCYGGNINEVIFTVPTNINMFIENGVKKSEQNKGYEVKRFSAFHGLQETAIKLNSKDELIQWIEQKKIEIIKSYEELLVQVVATKASNLYLSDNIKEKIFGNKKGAYKMRGENYNLSETDPTYGEEKNKLMEAEPDAEYPIEVNEEAPRPEPMLEAYDHQQRGGVVEERVVGFIGRLRPAVPVEIFEDGEGTDEMEKVDEDTKTLMTKEEMADFELEEKILEFEANERNNEKEEYRGLIRKVDPVEETPYDNDEHEVIVEDINGDVYVIENAEEQIAHNNQEQANEELPIPPPEDFNRIMRRAIRG